MHEAMHEIRTAQPRRNSQRMALALLCVVLLPLAAERVSCAQVTTPDAPAPAGPIAVVPIDSRSPDQAARVTGALEIAGGRAIIAASGSVTSGSRTTEVLLPHRGTLRVCASTTVKLAADSSASAGETPGLLLAVDSGALELSLANSSAGRNSDVLLTPDFRILISGAGAAEVKVRLGQHGDTCVDNAGANAPYVLVSSVFEGGAYRVQPGQRVMFQHGSLKEVVDQEKEPCGCPPPPAEAQPNEFPLAQSEGLIPTPPPAPAVGSSSHDASQTTATLAYNGAEHAPKAAATAETPAPTVPAAQAPAKKPGFMSRVGRFFRRIFGAE